MDKEYKIITKASQAEITEKKSRFIANVKTVNSEEEALAFINETKKKYYDARHNCFAYIIGEKSEISRFSDDGEPSGTAGKPILEVLQGSNVKNVCLVVTRYFGGTLLGTGGLVRAYTDASAACLSASVISRCYVGKKIQIESDYNNAGKIQYIMNSENIGQIDISYTDNVNLTCAVKEGDLDAFVKKITETTAARSKITDCGEIRFLQDDNNNISIL